MGSILAGIGSTSGLGEVSPHIDFAADVMFGPLGAEAYWTSADKIESPGWMGKATLTVNVKNLQLGIGKSHRHTAAWDKDATWLRAGLKFGPLSLFTERAVQGQNSEAKYEARLRLRHSSGLMVEPRVFAETYKDQSGNPHIGWGLSALAGYSWSK